MKFDSYTRFLKSPLYQECILAEVEGRSLPDSQQVPSSPASKHSVSSDHSNVSTPKKVPPSRSCPRHVPGGSCPAGGELCHAGFLHARSGQGTSGDAACGGWRVVPGRAQLPSVPGPGRRRAAPPRCCSSAASHARGFLNVFPLTAADREVEIRAVPE